MVNMYEYRRTIDHLEGLAHQAGTGYHISKAIKSRSEAIRNAVKKYNVAPSKLIPPRPSLDIAKILDYIYLTEFDLLWDSRNSLPTLPWSQPAEREATNAYFKLRRSHEKLKCVVIEARHLLTWTYDEEAILEATINELNQSNPALAHQRSKWYKLLTAINQIHRTRIYAMHALPNYTGSRTPGIRKGNRSALESAEVGGGSCQPYEWEVRREKQEEIDEEETNHLILESLDTTMHAISLVE
ncbi:hypothetical protein BU17DRAFT_101169 [Hysterangium stoloniferum]|nr:hypothetical protein BU17DRAFT_101169 [Hysterangium stoloniferum]